jgi:hypothetical protein
MEGGGAEATATLPQSGRPHLVLTLLWVRGDLHPLGLQVSSSDEVTQTTHFVSWHVLPVRSQSQIRELLRYCGLDLPGELERPSAALVDEQQLPLLPE